MSRVKEFAFIDEGICQLDVLLKHLRLEAGAIVLLHDQDDRALAAATGADVAAASDLVGAATRGGTRKLDVSSSQSTYTNAPLTAQRIAN